MLALVLATGLFLWQRTAFPLWTVDLFHIQYAAYCWQNDQPEHIYTTIDELDEWREIRAPVADRLGAKEYPNVHLYPPFVAVPLAGVADVPASYWRNLLFGINLLILPLFAWLIAKMCAHSISVRGFLWALALVLCTYPMARAMKLGQLSPLFAVLLWYGIFKLRAGRQVHAGMTLGLIAAVKLFPIALLGWLLLLRKYKAVLWGVSCAAAIYLISIALLGLDIHRDWWQSLSEHRSILYPFFGNQAPLGWIARSAFAYSHLEYFVPATSAVAIVRTLCTILFAVPTLWILTRHRERLTGNNLVYGFGLLICGILLTLPASWEHYWLFALPVLALAVHESWQQGDSRFWEILLAGAAFLFTMKLTRFYGDVFPGTIISGSQTAGMLLLWIWLIRRICRPLQESVSPCLRGDDRGVSAHNPAEAE